MESESHAEWLGYSTARVSLLAMLLKLLLSRLPPLSALPLHAGHDHGTMQHEVFLQLFNGPTGI